MTLKNKMQAFRKNRFFVLQKHVLSSNEVEIIRKMIYDTYGTNNKQELFCLQKGKARMAKLYFKYGAMGSSKSAQALITQFNYEELGMSVWLIKPCVDTRDGVDVVRSRIGLERHAQVIYPEQNIAAEYRRSTRYDVIIADESQFFTPAQIDQLRELVDEEDVPVLCFGLRTDFLTHFFPGSQRLMELADSLTEIKTVCACGRKATVNARIDENGRVITHGEQVKLGGNDSYIAMCHACWKRKIREQAQVSFFDEKQ